MNLACSFAIHLLTFTNKLGQETIHKVYCLFLRNSRANFWKQLRPVKEYTQFDFILTAAVREVLAKKQNSALILYVPRPLAHLFQTVLVGA